MNDIPAQKYIVKYISTHPPESPSKYQKYFLVDSSGWLADLAMCSDNLATLVTKMKEAGISEPETASQSLVNLTQMQLHPQDTIYHVSQEELSDALDALSGK